VGTPAIRHIHVKNVTFELAFSETTLTVQSLARKTRMFCDFIEKGIAIFGGGVGWGVFGGVVGGRIKLHCGPYTSRWP